MCADAAWRRLYGAGWVSALLFVILNIGAIVVDLATPPPVSGGAATLEFIAAHRASYSVEQQLWLTPGVFAMIVFVALYVALQNVDRSTAALGALIGGAAWALTLAIPTTSRGAPALVYLSDQYMAATGEAQRVALASAAEALIAQNNTPTLVGVLTTVGMLIISLTMVKGVFPKSVAYLGVAGGVVGVLSETLRFVLPNLYAVYGLLLLVWFAGVGWALYRLTRAVDPGSDGRREVSGR